MGVGIMVALFSAFVGLLIGSLAGYYGGWVDTVLMRITDGLLSLPIMPFLIVIAAIDLNKIPLFKGVVGSQNESIVKMVVILLLFSWMTIALLVRGSIYLCESVNLFWQQKHWEQKIRRLFSVICFQMLLHLCWLALPWVMRFYLNPH